MKIISIANQKGGVGKTTHANHLVWSLIDAGKRVLFVDVDPQQNSSTFFSHSRSDLPSASLFNKDCDARGVEEYLKNQLCVLYASGELQNVMRMEDENLPNLRENLKDFSEYYDYVVIDTPPTAGFSLKSVVYASDYVMLPMELKQWSVDGTVKMIKTIAGMSREKYELFGEKTEFLGVCINMFDRSDKSQPQAVEGLKNSPVAKFLMIGKQEQDGEIVEDVIKISAKNVIEHAQNLCVPVWKYNSVQNEIRSKAAIESAKEFTFLYKYLFPLIGVEFEGLISKLQSLKPE